MRVIMSMFVSLICVVMFVNCAKVIKPEDKPAYDRAVLAIAQASDEIKLTETSDVVKDLPNMFNSAKAHLATAKDYLDKDNYNKAVEFALKSSSEAKDVRELPSAVTQLIDDTEKDLRFANEVGLDKTYGKEIKRIRDILWDAKNKVRLKDYIIAKDFANQARNGIKKAIKDVEDATSAMTKAKTALADAKEAGADVSAADLYKSAEESLETARKEMENSNFNQCTEAAKKAKQLADDAAKKAKEGK